MEGYVEKGTWLPHPGTVLRSLIVVRLISAFLMHISDCDETFNYWEPTHYLLYGTGFQTWEYSPAYAVRSYGYLLLHVFPLLATNNKSKIVTFYLLRIILGVACALCESYLYRAVLSTLGGRVSQRFIFFLLGSCGMYVASTAFLPSSFSMYTTMVAMGAWLQGSYEVSIFAVAFGSLVGWPFSAALGIPIALDLVVSQRRTAFFLGWSILSFLIITIPLAAVDSLYYGKFVLAPLNILLYNVLGQGGPELYGVEPWYFYFINSFLNFNVVFVVALLAVLLIELEVLHEIVIMVIGRGQSTWQLVYNILLMYSGKVPSGVRITSTFLEKKQNRKVVQPMLIWMLIIFTRPHKEERFLFPIYPLFCLSAAIGLQLLPDSLPLLTYLMCLPKTMRRFCRVVVSWLPLVICITHTLLSLSRGYALYKGYQAPISLYKTISSDEAMQDVYLMKEINLCVGREWHRFPSSFFLPKKKWKLRFIRSEFRGQLPQPYSPYGNATSIVPEHMNDMNQEEPSRYFPVEDCHLLVDLDVPMATEREPRYLEDSNWELVATRPFLDAARSDRLFRSFYIPWLSEKHTVYAHYVLLKSRRFFTSTSRRLRDDKEVPREQTIDITPPATA